MTAFDTAALDRLLADDPGGPVVMLNLLRFRPDGGAMKYQAYGEKFESTGIYEKYGVELVYAGYGGTILVAEQGQRWDVVLLVRYPSRKRFVDMVTDPVYRSFEHLRTEALAETVLQATTPLAVG